MRDHVSEIRELGADVAAIGTGDVSYAAAFRDERGIDFPLLVDPELVSYAAVGTRTATAATVLRPRQAVRSLRALARHGQGRTGSHPFELGATHVITPEGDVRYAWINDDFGDHAPLDEILDALGRRGS